MPPAQAIAARQHPGLPIGAHAIPIPGLGDLTPADLVELAKGDANIFGMDSGTVGIAAGTTVTISAQPQKDCVPIRLIVSDTLADTFSINQMQVGVDNIMITPGTPCSLAAFTAGSFAPDFRAQRLRAPISFSVTVTNLSGAPARFLASVFAIFLQN